MAILFLAILDTWDNKFLIGYLYENKKKMSQILLNIEYISYQLIVF